MGEWTVGPAELSIKSVDAAEGQMSARITVSGTDRDILVAFAMLAHRLQELGHSKNLLLASVAVSDEIYKGIEAGSRTTTDKAAISEGLGRDPMEQLVK